MRDHLGNAAGTDDKYIFFTGFSLLVCVQWTILLCVPVDTIDIGYAKQKRVNDMRELKRKTEENPRTRRAKMLILPVAIITIFATFSAKINH